jgi:hypothetical protein
MQKLTSLLCIAIHIILIAQILPKKLAHRSMVKGLTRVEWNQELEYELGLLDNGQFPPLLPVYSFLYSSPTFFFTNQG